MSRGIVLLAFVSGFLALPADVNAQRGGGKGGGSQGGGQCQKGQSFSSPMTPTTSYAQPPGYSLPQAYAMPQVYAPQQGYALPSGTPLQQGYAVLETLVSQLRTNRINGSAAKALADDLKTAQQVARSTSLSKQQKEEKLLAAMTQALSDMQDLATDSALSPAQQKAVAGVVTQFQQLTNLAQGPVSQSINAKQANITR